MGLLAVKAAEELSKYIVDKYHYGIECNTCQYKYAYYSRLDFMSDCLDVCYDDTVTVTTLDTTIDCTGAIPSYVAGTTCTPEGQILQCGVTYETREMQAFEINSFIYLETVTTGNIVRLEFNSAIVNGVSYLSATRYVYITQSNATVQNVAGLQYITNIITFLNSLNLPGFTFYPGESGRTMKVRFPQGTTWSITGVASNGGDETAHGALINQDGLVSLQLTVAGAYLVPPYVGSVGIYWLAGYELLKSEMLC